MKSTSFYLLTLSTMALAAPQSQLDLGILPSEPEVVDPVIEYTFLKSGRSESEAVEAAVDSAVEAVVEQEQENALVENVVETSMFSQFFKVASLYASDVAYGAMGVAGLAFVAGLMGYNVIPVAVRNAFSRSIDR